MNQLSEYAQRLYDAGLKNLWALGKDNAASRKRLYTACRDADKWIALCAESSSLYEHTLCTPYPSPDWTMLLQADKQVTKLTSKLLMNARQYGWTPLARSILRRRAMMLPAPEEYDALEEIMQENEKRMRQQDMENDPMEEVLSAYEPTG